MTLTSRCNWDAKRVKHVSQLVTSGSRGWAEFYADEGAIFIRIGNLTERGIDLDLADLQHVRVPAGAEGARTRVKQGDVLISITALIGAIGLVRHAIGESYVNQHLALVRPTSIIDARWLAYALRSQLGRDQFMLRMYGGTKVGLGLDDVREVAVPLPPLPAQCALADILDRNTAALDALIAKKERFIELLQEKRQALITQAVTNGLDPNVPMKESGIEWLGPIPSHWLLSRGRFLFRELALPPQEDDGVVTAFRDGQVTLRKNRRTEGFMFADKEAGYQHVRVGDLVIHSMDAFAGAVGVSESNGKCTPEYVVMEPARNGVVSAYYALLLRVMAQRNYIFVVSPSVRERAPRFRFVTFKDVELPVPPLAEQCRIVQHIATGSASIDQLVGAIQKQVALMREYRQALITAAVTGKIDVSNEAA